MMNAGAKAVRAAIYCRISLAAMGDTTKVDDQEAQCREVCRARGWEVAGVFTDNSRSAWKRDRKRPGWDAMLDGVRAGRFDAIVSYWGDRIARQPRDLEDLLDLREGRSISMASVMGQYDFGNKDHRMMMRWEVARACNESDTISQRVSNRHDLRRAKGLVRSGGRGGRAFGFAADGMAHYPADRCDAATRAEVSEADIVREMAARVLAGERTGAIARDVSARGWRTPAGGEFTHGTVRKMLARPRYAGLMPDGEAKAAWEPVLGRETWERVRLVLDGNAARFGYASNARRWLLSGIALCGAPGCGEPLRIKPSKGRGRKEYAQGYACPRKGCGKTYRSAPLLDAYVTGRLVSRLNDPRAPEPEVPAAPDHAQEWAALAAEREQAEQLTRDYAASAGRLALLMARLDSIDARMGQLREAEAGDARSRLLDRHRGITREEFESMPLAGKRSLVAAAFRITVLPASRRGPGFRTEDVGVEPLG